MHQSAIRSLGHRFHAADSPLFFQRYRHWTFAMGHRPPVGPMELPGAAELAGSYLGTTAPQLCGSLVKERDPSGGVGCVNGGGERLNDGLQARLCMLNSIADGPAHPLH